MPVWAALQHVSFETPALIGEEAVRRGIELQPVRMDLGDRLPAAAQLDGLIVMGGPMGVMDTDEHPRLIPEMELIEEAVTLDLPVLGVCLGAQLLAAALGARVYRGHGEEIGAGEVDLVSDDPVLGREGGRLPVLHWHGDTFDLPDGARLLASSEEYENQAFRFGRRAYGLQFHVEIGREAAESITPHLPEHVRFDETDRIAIETAGIPVISRFFDIAT